MELLRLIGFNLGTRLVEWAQRERRSQQAIVAWAAEVWR